MPLTAAETRAFFENANNIGLPHNTAVALRAEGISTIDDLLKFDKSSIEQIANNFRRSTPQIPFNAKAQKRLIEACDLLRFYTTIGREPTQENLRYTTIRNFSEQWKSLKERREEDPEVPKLTRELGVLRWSEAFKDHLSRSIGSRCAPLSYVTRAVVAPAEALPEVAQDRPHTEENGSVEADLAKYATHDHPLFRDDSAKIYFALETATRGTMYASSLKPFQRNQDGRAAYQAILSQYAGIDKWDTELKRCNTLLTTRQWKGQSNFSLEKFVSQHRNAYISMQQCAEYVSFQLPNELTRVKYLLDAIDNSNAELQAAIAMIRQDDGDDGKMNNFEAAVAYLIPRDPVSKKRVSGNKRPQAEVSGVSSKGTKKKARVGVTGVELRFHSKQEYAELSKLQKDELHEWRRTRTNKPDNKPKGGQGKARKHESSISSVLAKAVKDSQTESKEEAKEAKEAKAIEAYIMSVVNKNNLNNPVPRKGEIQQPVKIAAVDTTPKGLKNIVKPKAKVSAVELKPKAKSSAKINNITPQKVIEIDDEEKPKKRLKKISKEPAEKVTKRTVEKDEKEPQKE